MGSGEKLEFSCTYINQVPLRRFHGVWKSVQADVTYSINLPEKNNKKQILLTQRRDHKNMKFKHMINFETNKTLF